MRGGRREGEGGLEGVGLERVLEGEQERELERVLEGEMEGVCREELERPLKLLCRSDQNILRNLWFTMIIYQVFINTKLS